MKSYLSGIAGALLLGFVSVPAAHAVVVSGSIDASTEVDYIYFSTTSADTVSIDVYAHGVLGGLDPWIYLYHDDGTLTADDLITYNDDGGDAGLLDSSTSIYDSYIETALAPGAYVIAISGYFFSIPDALAGYNTGSSLTGGYQITITGGGAAVVPLPAALPLFLSGLVGLGVVGWRNRRRAAPPATSD